MYVWETSLKQKKQKLSLLILTDFSDDMLMKVYFFHAP